MGQLVRQAEVLRRERALVMPSGRWEIEEKEWNREPKSHRICLCRTNSIMCLIIYNTCWQCVLHVNPSPHSTIDRPTCGPHTQSHSHTHIHCITGSRTVNDTHSNSTDSNYRLNFDILKVKCKLGMLIDLRFTGNRFWNLKPVSKYRYW